MLIPDGTHPIANPQLGQVSDHRVGFGLDGEENRSVFIMRLQPAFIGRPRSWGFERPILYQEPPLTSEGYLDMNEQNEQIHIFSIERERDREHQRE